MGAMDKSRILKEAKEESYENLSLDQISPFKLAIIRSLAKEYRVSMEGVDDIQSFSEKLEERISERKEKMLRRQRERGLFGHKLISKDDAVSIDKVSELIEKL